MRSAVRAVTAHLIFFIIVVVDRIQFGVVGHRLMEGSIKDERHLFIGHDLAARVHTENRRRIVQGSQVLDFVH